MEREKAERRLGMFTAKKGKVMGAESGEEAVQFADALKDMKQSEGGPSEADEASGIRYAAGHAFRYRDGVWVDLRFERGEMKLTKIAYMSQAWFALMKKSTDLKQAFGLGERVIVVIDDDTAIEVAPDGKKKLSQKELNKLTP